MSRPLKILAVMDPYEGYNWHKDTSHLLLKNLFERDHHLFYTTPAQLFIKNGAVVANGRAIMVQDGFPYFTFDDEALLPLNEFRLILMRKDPPVNTLYRQATHLLSLVQEQTWVINRPSSLMSFNEKLSIFHFAPWIPRTTVTSRPEEIALFLQQAGGIGVLKDLNSYASKGVRKISLSDPDLNIIIDRETANGKKVVMMQEFLPVHEGEKRVFIVDGKMAGAIRRRPPEGSFLTDPDRGGVVTATSLTPREEQICQKVGHFFSRRGVFFAGLDLIDEKLTDINITSPGLLCEWNETDGESHEKEIIDLLESKL